jgi:hypothetical protein
LLRFLVRKPRGGKRQEEFSPPDRGSSRRISERIRAAASISGAPRRLGWAGGKIARGSEAQAHTAVTRRQPDGKTAPRFLFDTPLGGNFSEAPNSRITWRREWVFSTPPERRPPRTRLSSPPEQTQEWRKAKAPQSRSRGGSSSGVLKTSGFRLRAGRRLLRPLPSSRSLYAVTSRRALRRVSDPSGVGNSS